MVWKRAGTKSLKLFGTHLENRFQCVLYQNHPNGLNTGLNIQQSKFSQSPILLLLHSQSMWARPNLLQYTLLTMFIIYFSVSDQNKVLHGGLRAHNRWMPIMLMKYCRNIVTHAICCDKKGACMLRERICLCSRKARLMGVCVCAVRMLWFMLQTKSLDWCERER